jgi:hypothetical protein
MSGNRNVVNECRQRAKHRLSSLTSKKIQTNETTCLQNRRSSRARLPCDVVVAATSVVGTTPSQQLPPRYRTYQKKKRSHVVKVKKQGCEQHVSPGAEGEVLGGF